MLKQSTHLCLALAATGLLLAPAASAAPAAQEDYAIGVTHADLDLSTEEGKAELERRIDRAVKQVCAMDEAQVGTLLNTREQRLCYRQTKRQFDRHYARIIANAERGG